MRTFVELFNQIEAKLTELELAEDAFQTATLEHRRVLYAAKPDDELPAFDMTTGRPVGIPEPPIKPTMLFVGRLGMTLIAENFRPDQIIVSMDPVLGRFKVLWLTVEYVPQMPADGFVVGIEKDRPQ